MLWATTLTLAGSATRCIYSQRGTNLLRVEADEKRGQVKILK